MKVLIDPGHAPGNANGGKRGYKEYAGMWKLSNMLRDILTAFGVSADLTREENQDPTLETRGGMARGYDLFISEHSNAYNDAARGVECYYSVKRPNDMTIAAKLSAVVAAVMGNPCRGAKTRMGANNADYYGVIRAAATAGCPHVFLIENGFHDNDIDEMFLLDDENLRCIAEAQAKVIIDVLISGNVDNRQPKPPDATIVPAKTPIMGESVLTAEQLAAFLLKTNPSPKINCTALDLARFFVEEGIAEGVRGDVAFCQSIHETGWFRYGGQVLPEQNNYAGIGAVNGSPVGKGAWFESPRIGVRAQIQHLKAYASTEALANDCVDLRFGLVKRGMAPCWEDLNGKWAVPGTAYGQGIVKLWDKAKAEVLGDTIIPTTKVDEPSDWAVASWNWAKINGIIDGTNPKNNITREQVVAILHRYSKLSH